MVGLARPRGDWGVPGGRREAGGRLASIVVGGNGKKKTLQLAAKYADEWNGTRKVKFSAAIYITDCGCSAIGDKQTVVSDT